MDPVFHEASASFGPRRCSVAIMYERQMRGLSRREWTHRRLNLVLADIYVLLPEAGAMEWYGKPLPRYVLPIPRFVVF